jgi:hypothetical protein
MPEGVIVGRPVIKPGPSRLQEAVLDLRFLKAFPACVFLTAI